MESAIMNLLALPIPERIVSTFGLFGLILATVGAFTLAKPAIKNEESNNNNSTVYKGVKYIFLGFSLQLLDKVVTIFNNIESLHLQVYQFIILITVLSLLIFPYVKKLHKNQKESQNGN